MAQANAPTMIPIATLSPDHLVCLKQAVSNILSTKQATSTYAQVAWGVPSLPLRAANVSPELLEWRQAHNVPIEPSTEAYSLVERWRSDLNITSLGIDAKVLQRFENESLRSRQFYLRLIEVVVHVVHELAATLCHHVEGGLYKLDLPQGIGVVELALSEYWPGRTVLFHPIHCSSGSYPRGVGDTVGYWAEEDLLGGPVYYDRSVSDTDVSQMILGPTSRIDLFQLPETKVQEFIQALTSDTGEAMSRLLPLEVDESPAEPVRLIDYRSCARLKIFRDQYDLKDYQLVAPISRCVVRPSSEDTERLQQQYESLQTQFDALQHPMPQDSRYPPT